MHGLQRYLREDSGAVAPIVAVALVALVSMGGLAYDVSRAFALRTELDSAVDAAALAGATQLDGSAGARDRATAAVQGAFVQNAQRLADAGQSNVTASGVDISFYSALDLSDPNNPVRTGATGDGDARFVRIVLSPRNLGLVFGGLVRTGGFSVRAAATAGYGAAICKVPPLMICNPDEPVGNLNKNLSFNGDAHRGQGIVIKGSGSTGAWGPGAFGYLSVSGNTDAIKDAMARNPPLAECFGQTVQTQPGNNASILDYFNIRFDIFTSGLPASFQGDAHYAPAQNTLTGLPVTSGAGATLCKPKSNGVTYNGSFVAGLTAMPLPRDTCAYPSGGSTCAGAPNSIGNGNWDKATYFKVVHPEVPAVDPITAPTGEAWSSFGPAPAAGNQPTRYQVYKWELANRDDNSAWPGGQNSATGENKDFVKPRCGVDAPSTPDRRTISVVVVNCIAHGVKGSMPVTTAGAVDMFLTEPASNTGPDMIIYGEIIGATSPLSEVGKETMVYSVRLYE